MWKGWGRHAPGKESCECQGSKVRNWLGVCKEQKVIEKRIIKAESRRSRIIEVLTDKGWMP